MYRTILVPLDGSKRAEAILPHVVQLAKRYDAKVVFVRVIEPVTAVIGLEGTPFMLYQQEFEQRVEQAESYLATLSEEFQKRGIQTQTHVVHGPVVEAVIDTAQREGADLIAIASHGRSGLSQVFYGSVAAGVLQRADRPLLLIRAQDRD